MDLNTKKSLSKKITRDSLTEKEIPAFLQLFTSLSPETVNKGLDIILAVTQLADTMVICNQKTVDACISAVDSSAKEALASYRTAVDELVRQYRESQSAEERRDIRAALLECLKNIHEITIGHQNVLQRGMIWARRKNCVPVVIVCGAVAATAAAVVVAVSTIANNKDNNDCDKDSGDHDNDA